MTLSESDLGRFWSKIVVAGLDDCWIWQAGKDQDGYGVFWAQGRSWRAHRIALFLRSGTMAAMACHSCDVPACCNGRHLFQGTALTNNRDALHKGRYAGRAALRAPSSYARGEAQGRSRLTRGDVVRIRERAAQGESIASIRASLSPITWEAVAAVVKRRTWRHV